MLLPSRTEKREVASLDNLKEMLEELGYQLRNDGKYWRTKALYRGGKNGNSISIDKKTGYWSDFGSNITSQPISRLFELHGKKGPVSGQMGPVPIRNEIEDAQIDKIYPESILKNLLPHYKFYTEKGISEDCLIRLKSGMATKGKMYRRFVFPIFNQGGQIIGFSGRDMSSSSSRPKWKLLGKKRNFAYPLHIKDSEGRFFAKEAIEKSGEIIIVESVGDMLAFHTRGIYNVIVSFGVKILPSCIYSILELSPDRIYICYNNDEQKGENNTGKISSVETFLLLLKYFDYNSISICLPIKKDFGEMNDVDFRKWYEKKNSIDFDAQRDMICTLAAKYSEENKISKKSFENYKLLDC